MEPFFSITSEIWAIFENLGSKIRNGAPTESASGLTSD